MSFVKQGNPAMSVNGLHCTLNMPRVLQQRYGSGGEELSQGLPPYAPQAAYSVLEYDEHCPAEWMRGSAMENSCFVPVKPEHGLWLDFNANRGHSHHVAVRISVQKICPITGMKTDNLRLEQYRVRCPKHDVPFEAERFCPVCGYKWPAQNYLASNATPGGLLWLDGFRGEEGVVRQYVFTTEVRRGVAAQLIGSERVFAIGIGFYLSKEPKPPEPVFHPRYGGGEKVHFASGGGKLYSHKGAVTRSAFTASLNMSDEAPSIEVAAGAKIRQQVYPDPEELSFWQDQPAGILYINYTDEATAEEILRHGPRDLTAGGEGFMSGLLVGDIPKSGEIQ